MAVMFVLVLIRACVQLHQDSSVYADTQLMPIRSLCLYSHHELLLHMTALHCRQFSMPTCYLHGNKVWFVCRAGDRGAGDAAQTRNAAQLCDGPA